MLFLTGFSASAQFDLLIDSLNVLVRSEPESALELLTPYISDSVTRNFTPEELDLAWYAHAYYTQQTGQYDEAIFLAKNYVSNSEKIKDYFRFEDFYNVIASSYIALGKTDSATKYFIKCGEILESSGQFRYLAYLNNNIGNIYLDDLEFEHAVRYLKKSSNLMRQVQDTTYLGLVLGNISQAYSELAIIDSTLKYAQKAKRVAVNTIAFNGYFNAQISESIIFQIQGDTQRAIDHLWDNYHLTKEKNNTRYKHITTSYLLPLIPSDDKSLNMAEEAYDYFDKNNPRFKSAMGDILADEYFLQNKPKKAYQLLKLTKQYSDSLSSIDFRTAKEELLTKYESALKDKLISQKGNQVAKEKLKNERLYRLILGIVSLLAILLIVIFVYRRNIRQKICLIREKKEKEVLKALIMGEENERQRLAKELHDGLANDIAALKLNMGIKTMTNQPADKAVIEEWKNKLDSLHQNTREMSHDLLPKALLESGLAHSIQALVMEYNSTMPLSVEVENINYIDNKTRSFDLFLYRIIQELLGNAIRHSEASNVFLNLEDNGQKITLIVHDDGKGIVEDSKETKLSFLNERLKSMGAQLKVDSNSNQGTKIKIEIAYGD